MISLFIGRFQPFHKGHLHDVKNALKFSKKVIIAIGSSIENNTSENPFAFSERKDMIESVLHAENISDFEIVAIPDINDDSKWVEHVKKIVNHFDVVYTGNDWVKKLFLKKGVDVRDVMLLKDVNATEIRTRIRNGDDWEDLVPEKIASFIKSIDGIENKKN